MGRQDLNQIRSKCYGISKNLSMGYHIFGTKIEILRLREMREVVKDHTFSVVVVVLLLLLADAGLCIWGLSLSLSVRRRETLICDRMFVLI